MSNNTTLSLNPQLNKTDSKEIQLDNTKEIIQSTPLDSTQAQNIESAPQENVTEETNPKDVEKETQIESTPKQRETSKDEKDKSDFIKSFQSAAQARNKLNDQYAWRDVTNDDRHHLMVTIGNHLMQYGDIDNDFKDYHNALDIAKNEKEIYEAKNYNELSDKAKEQLSEN